MNSPTEAIRLEPMQTAREAADQLNTATGRIEQAQRFRVAREESAHRAKALWQRELRKALTRHRGVTPADVRKAMCEDAELTPEVAAEAAELAREVGLPANQQQVADLELLYDLCDSLAKSAKDAGRVWERWADNWRIVAAWSRDDAGREMGRSA